MNTFVFGVAVGIFFVLIYKAICMAITEYRSQKRKWWLK